MTINIRMDAAYRCSVRLDVKSCTPPNCASQYPLCNQEVRRHSNYYTPAPAPLAEAQIEQEAITKMAQDPAAQTRLYDALQKDWRAKPTLAPAANPLYLKRDASVIRERILCLPDFPTEIRLHQQRGGGIPFTAAEVIVWVESYRERSGR